MKNHFDLDDAIEILERTPASLRALLEGLPDTWLRATEGENTTGQIVWPCRKN